MWNEIDILTWYLAPECFFYPGNVLRYNAASTDEGWEKSLFCVDGRPRRYDHYFVNILVEGNAVG